MDALKRLLGSSESRETGNRYLAQQAREVRLDEDAEPEERLRFEEQPTLRVEPQ